MKYLNDSYKGVQLPLHPVEPSYIPRQQSHLHESIGSPSCNEILISVGQLASLVSVLHLNTSSCIDEFFTTLISVIIRTEQSHWILLNVRASILSCQILKSNHLESLTKRTSYYFYLPTPTSPVLPPSILKVATVILLSSGTLWYLDTSLLCGSNHVHFHHQTWASQV